MTRSAPGWQTTEGALMAAAGLAIAIWVPGAGWMPWLMLLAPDLAMVGYLAGPRVGAAVYNAAHLYAAGLILMLAGAATGHPPAIAAGALWMAHVGADRALGFGLKLPSGFRHTHLGHIGKGGDPGR